MSRPVRVLVALALVAVAAVVTAALVVPRMPSRELTVTAHFEDAVGLYVGNGVSVLGMSVGTVKSIVNKDTYVEVELQIDDSVPIPADVEAVTVSNSILTDRVVELTPPYRGGAVLKNGDIIGLGRTRTPVEFDSTLAMMHELGSALGGDANGQGPLGDLVNLGAEITSVNGPKLKETLDELASALATGPDRGARSRENLQAIITSISELTSAATENDTAIREFGSNLRQLSDVLAEEELGSGTTGAKANQLLEQAQRILEGNQDGLTATFADSQAIATTLTDYRRELEETLDVAPLGVDNIYNAIDPVAGSLRAHALLDKIIVNSQFTKEVCNLMGLKQLGCATGTLADYGPDFGVTSMLDLMANGITEPP